MVVNVKKFSYIPFNSWILSSSLSLQDKVLVGGILLTHLQNLPCNAHTLDELEVPPGSVKDSVQVSFTFLAQTGALYVLLV